jgi:hypothetical protein
LKKTEIIKEIAKQSNLNQTTNGEEFRLIDYWIGLGEFALIDRLVRINQLANELLSLDASRKRGRKET